MNDHQMGQAIQGIQQGLLADDPAFVRRFRARWRNEACVVCAVFALLALGAVLLTVGVAVPSWPAWVAGLAALVGAAVVDAIHKRI